MIFLNEIIKYIHKKTTTIRYKLIKESYYDWLKNGEKILDIGSGSGLISDYIRKDFNSNIIVSDIKNQLNFGLDMNFVTLKENERLPFKDNSFDCIMFNDVLHHITNQGFILKEAIRVSREKILIFECQPDILYKFWDIFGNFLYYGKQANVPLNARNKDGWISFFNNIGIKNIEFKKLSKWWYPLNHIAFNLKKKY